MTLNSYKDLLVWQKGIDLVNEVYILTKQLPKDEQFGLVSQMRRAAVAIPSNIAEGYRRNHKAEYRHFLAIAFGSAAELETQLIIIEKQYKIIDIKSSQLILEEVLKMLNTIISKLKD